MKPIRWADEERLKEIYLFNALGMLDGRFYPDMDWIWNAWGPDGIFAFIREPPPSGHGYLHWSYETQELAWLNENWMRKWLSDLAKPRESLR